MNYIIKKLSHSGAAFLTFIKKVFGRYQNIQQLKKSMKKNSLLVALFFVIAVSSQAQKDSITKKQTFHGIVKNEKNKPLQNASVIVKGEEKGTITDSLGYFKVNAGPDAVLVINAEGYETLLAQVRKGELFRVVMKKTKETNTNNNSVADEISRQQSASNDVRNYLTSESSKNYTGSYLTVLKNKESTVGSRFLLDEWISYNVVHKNDSVVYTNGYLFNYDKMGGKILATNDKKTILEIDDTAIKSFSFIDLSGKKISFKKINIIDKNMFLIELVNESGKDYSLYKSLKTEFVKANYTNNGLIQSGNKYDEYVDKFEYFIEFPGLKTFTKVELKEKAIKKALTGAEEKVKAFFEMNKAVKINEALLIQLISYLNQ